MPSYVSFSNITVSDVVSFLRLETTETTAEELALLATILEAAKNYCLVYTGRNKDEADNMPEMTIAVYNVCADMYDKRTFTVEADKANKIVETILGARSTNLL